MIHLSGVPKLKLLASKVELMFDGTSLVYGTGSTTSWPAYLQTIAPVNGILCRNFAAPGITIAGMRSDAFTSVDTVYEAGSTNIITVQGATNTIWGSTALTAAEVAGQIAGYCSERIAAFAATKAANPASRLYIILMTEPPRYNTDGAWGSNLTGGNAALTAYNEYIKANYRAMGADMCIDIRASGDFAYTGPTMTAEMDLLYSDLIHYSDAGRVLIAEMVAAAFRRIPAR